MSQRKIKSFVLGLALMLLFTMPQGLMATGTDGVVRGRLVLPNGILAPEGGLEIYVSAESREENRNSTSLGYEMVTIAEGESSVDFEVNIDYDLVDEGEIINEKDEFLITYYMYRDQDLYMRNEDIYDSAYYLKDGSSIPRIDSYQYVYADLFSTKDGDLNIGDFKIIPTTKVSGKISLPDGKLAPKGGLGVSISIGNPDFTSMEPDFHSIRIEEATNSKEYTIYVPDLGESTEYLLEYNFDSQYRTEVIDPEYYSTGYYNSEETKANPFNREIITVGKNNSESFDFQVISFEELKGKVTLPKNADFSSLPGELEIKAQDMINDNVNVYHIKNFTSSLEKGSSVIDYHIGVPKTSEGIEYKIKYEYRDGSNTIEGDTGIRAKMMGQEINGLDFTIGEELVTEDVEEVPVNKEFQVSPTSSEILVNGEKILFEAYLINENHYFKLRDLGKVVSGTEKEFEVKWNDGKKAIELTSNEAYTEVGGELTLGDSNSKKAIQNTSTIYKDGEEVNLNAYTIEGHNYFKLRDMAEAFNIGVTWDGENQMVLIDTSIDYVAE